MDQSPRTGHGQKLETYGHEGAPPEQAMLKALDKAFGLYRHELAGEVRAMMDLSGAAEIAERLAPDVRRKIAEARKS